MIFALITLGPSSAQATITEIIDATGDGGGKTLKLPIGIAVDCAGNVYVTGEISDNAFKITPGGVITEIIDATGDGTGNTLNTVRGIAVDGSGNIYIAGENSFNAFKITPTPDLSVTKIDSSDPVVVGDSFTYTVTVTNNDISFDATNVVLTDTLPTGVSLVSTTGCAEDSNGAPTCTLGTINASTSKGVTITVDANTDGLATNSASVSADQTDPNPRKRYRKRDHAPHRRSIDVVLYRDGRGRNDRLHGERCEPAGDYDRGADGSAGGRGDCGGHQRRPDADNSGSRGCGRRR